MRMRPATERALPVVLAVAGLGGCGGSNIDGAAPPSAVTSDLRVGLTEFAVRTTAARAVPGPVTLHVTNAGSAPHDVEASEHGTVLGRTVTLNPGGTALLVLDVRSPGPLTLTCTLPGHRAAGMTTTVPVA